MLCPYGGAVILNERSRAKVSPRAAFIAQMLIRRCGSGHKRPFGVAQRTFSVARPIIARISEMIQNRITIVGSAQPFFS